MISSVRTGLQNPTDVKSYRKSQMLHSVCSETQTNAAQATVFVHTAVFVREQTCCIDSGREKKAGLAEQQWV